MFCRKPLISIIIPSFNQGVFIQETIESILKQHYRPIEIVIVDASSTDNTIEILHKYDKFAEVKWISEPDNGHADGVNKGFSRAKGEIISWLNADDVYYSTEVFTSVAEFFIKNSQIDVLYGDVAIISAESILLRLFLLPSFKKGRILRQNFISQPAVFMRRNVIESEKLDFHYIGLDYEYWLRLVTKGFNFYHMRKILACDRHYLNRISVTHRSTIESQIADVKMKMRLSQLHSKLMFPIDRLFQAVCRIRGFILLLHMPFELRKKYFAFPLKIDSYPQLLWRQLTKPVGSDFRIKKRDDLNFQ